MKSKEEKALLSGVPLPGGSFTPRTLTGCIPMFPGVIPARTGVIRPRDAAAGEP